MNKSIRKAFIILLAGIVAFSESLFASAYESEKSAAQAREYAYMDLESATTEVRAKIVEARKELIFNESWAADGIEAYVVTEEGNVVEKLPEFSELFPKKWATSIVDNVERQNRESNSNDAMVEPYSNFTYATQSYRDNVTLYNPGNYDSRPFRIINTTRHTEGETGYIHEETDSVNCFSQILSGYTYNLGYTNVTSGLSLAYKINLRSGEGLMINNPPQNIRLGIRASSYTIGGTHEFFTLESFKLESEDYYT